MMRFRAVACGAALFAALWAAPPPARADVAALEASTSGPNRDNPTGAPQVAGTATADSGCVINSVKLKVTSPDSRPVPDVLSIEGNSETSQSFNWSPPLTHNGHYVIEIEATQSASGPLASCGGTATLSVPLWVEAAPAPVTISQRSADTKARTMTLVWNRAPEPDLLGYLVYRDHTESDPEPVFGTEQPGSGSVRFVDDLSELPGGEYDWSVVALRPSADWFQSDPRRPPAASAETDSARAAATMPPQPKPVTTTTPGARGGNGSGSGSGGSGNLRSTGKVDFGAFASALETNRKATTTTEFDPGFEENLPFSDRDVAIREPGADLPFPEDAEERPTSLLLIATGMLMLAVAAHLFWLKREVALADLEALRVESSPVEDGPPETATDLVSVPSALDLPEPDQTPPDSEADSPTPTRRRRVPPGSTGPVRSG